MKNLELFDVKLEQTNWNQLSQDLQNLRPKSKAVVNFVYSEVLLRAKRNLAYKQVLQNITFPVIDGTGLHWAAWVKSVKSEKEYLAQIRKRLKVKSWNLEKLFIWRLLKNFVIGFLAIIFRYDFGRETGNKVVLGREFVYEILRIGQNKSLKTLLIGGSESLKLKLQKLYPDLNLQIWYKDSNSQLMRDEANFHLQLPKKEGENELLFKHRILNLQNVYEAFPDLIEAKELVKKEQFDLILVCIGGASGKQEFFIEDLRLDNEIEFTLAAGLGAALDHLGAGAQQKEPPKMLQSRGLEWFYRFLFQPQRRFRIWDSIFSLWWFVSKE